MPEDLEIKEGETLHLNDDPPNRVADSYEETRLTKLSDLVDLGVVESEEKLDNLIDAAKEATSWSIRRRETYSPRISVHGSLRPDLRRFGSFLASSPLEAKRTESHAFWRIIRRIEPRSVEKISADTSLDKVGYLGPLSGMARRVDLLRLYRFLDVTVGSNATLKLTTDVFRCHNLVIEAGGLIEVEGNVHIDAFSIEGE